MSNKPTNFVWSVGNIRLTALYSSPELRDPGDSYNVLFSQEPELSVTDKKQAQRRDSGGYLGLSAHVTSSPGRQEVVLSDASDGDSKDGDQLWTWGNAMKTAKELGSKWAKLVAPSDPVRFAFGTEIRYKVESREQGYRLLQEYLPKVTLDENSSEFSYQINRSRIVSIAGSDVRVNRLSRWAVRVYNPIVFRATLSPEQGATLLPRGNDVSYAGADLDINTDALRLTPFGSASEVEAVLVELITLADEIARKGDVP
jgi:hypothetical protein